jgi:hypothetical protein
MSIEKRLTLKIHHDTKTKDNRVARKVRLFILFKGITLIDKKIVVKRRIIKIKGTLKAIFRLNNIEVFILKAARRG